MIRITVKMLGNLSAGEEKAEEEVRLRDGITAAQMLAKLSRSYASFPADLLRDGALSPDYLVLIDGTSLSSREELAAVLKDGCRVFIAPSIGGG